MLLGLLAEDIHLVLTETLVTAELQLLLPILLKKETVERCKDLHKYMQETNPRRMFLFWKGVFRYPQVTSTWEGTKSMRRVTQNTSNTN